MWHDAWDAITRIIMRLRDRRPMRVPSKFIPSFCRRGDVDGCKDRVRAKTHPFGKKEEGRPSKTRDVVVVCADVLLESCGVGLVTTLFSVGSYF